MVQASLPLQFCILASLFIVDFSSISLGSHSAFGVRLAIEFGVLLSAAFSLSSVRNKSVVHRPDEFASELFVALRPMFAKVALQSFSYLFSCGWSTPFLRSTHPCGLCPTAVASACLIASRNMGKALRDW